MDERTIGHAELDVGGSQTIMLATPTRDLPGPEAPRCDLRGGCTLARNPWVVDGLLVLVDDLEAHHAQAVAAGAHVIRPIADGPDGSLYTAEDVEGHRWMFQQAAR